MQKLQEVKENIHRAGCLVVLVKLFKVLLAYKDKIEAEQKERRRVKVLNDKARII